MMMEHTSKALLFGLATTCLLMAHGVHGGCCDAQSATGSYCDDTITMAQCAKVTFNGVRATWYDPPRKCGLEGTPAVLKCVCPPGTLCGDPHVTGFDGSHYILWGRENRTYDILSERNHQVNARLFDDRPAEKRKESHALFIDAMGIMINNARITVRMVATANADGVEPEVASAITAARTTRAKRLVVSASDVDGTKHHDVWIGKPATRAVDSYTVYNFTDETHVTIGSNQISLTILLQEDHHLDFQVNAIAPFWSNVHGVLGQTYSAAFGAGGAAAAGGGAAEGVPKATGKQFDLEGKEDEYITSGLLSADDKFSKFVVGGTKLYEMVADGSAVSRKLLKGEAAATGASDAGGNIVHDVLMDMLPCRAGLGGDV